MKHEEAYDLIEAYAFGTLESEEADAVEAHLDSGCPECVARYRIAAEVSAQLATALPQEDPAPHVKEKLFQKIRGARSPKAARPDRAKIIPLNTALGWGTAALAAAALLLMVVWSNGMRSELRQIKSGMMIGVEELADMRERLDEYENHSVVLGGMDMRFIDLVNYHADVDANGTVAIDTTDDILVVYVFNLPQMPEDQEYHLWMVRDEQPVDCGSFAVDGDGCAVIEVEDLVAEDRILELTVTAEPLGAAPKPTGREYMWGSASF